MVYPDALSLQAMLGKQVNRIIAVCLLVFYLRYWLDWVRKVVATSDA